MPTYRDKSGTATDGASKKVADALPGRIYMFFMNLSDADMRISFEADASATTGIIVKAGGGYYESPAMMASDQQVNVFVTGASKNYTYYEC